LNDVNEAARRDLGSNPKRPMNQKRSTIAGDGRNRTEDGFTIRDLLGLLAVTAFLLVILLSSLAAARPDTAASRCMNNLRQLGAAWSMYLDDNRGWLVWNRDGGNAGKAAGMESWVGGWMDFTWSTDNTNRSLLIDHTHNPYGAFLGPYLKTASVFKCPADVSTSPANEGLFSRVRSVSMNNCAGRGGRLWSGPISRFTLYQQASQIRMPSSIFVLLDEHPDSINDGCFMTDPDTRYQLIDFPGSYHQAAGSFAFADGHTEFHRWQDPRTLPAFVNGVELMLNINMAGDADIDWLQAHASERR
jgi:hypothetical protein